MQHQPTTAARHLGATAFIVALFAITTAHAAELHGRITDIVSKKSVTGATVSLVPAAGDTLTARTGAFGFYTLTDIPAGDFTLEVRHRSYQPHDEPFTTTASATSTADAELVPLFPAEPQVDLLVDVTDTRAGKPLPNIPVRIQRFSLADPNTLEETVTPFTDAGGRIQLPGFRPGHYTFRFNHPADGTRVPFYQPLDISAKSRLEQPHAVHAQLLPDSQQMVVRVLGPDPARPDDGEVPLAGVAVDLTGVSETLDPSYNPFEDALIDVVTEILPTRTAVTDADGKVTFKNLPPITYLIEAKKHGFLASAELRGPDPGSLVLPGEHVQHLVLDPDTTTWMFFTSPYPDPALMTGLEVKLEGIQGTNTEGITRDITAVEVLPDPDHYPDGAMWADFPGLLPGRYRVSVDQTIPTPDTYVVNDFEFKNLNITYQGGRCIDVAQGTTNSEVVELRVVPATVRGRFLVADEPRALDFGTTVSETLGTPNFLDAVYKPHAQQDIQLTQSLGAFLLPFDLAVVSFESDASGQFTASVLPSAYGVDIPAMAGYWGANHEIENLTTGDRATRGWPYSVFPFQFPAPVPAPPFGSFAIPLESGQDYQLTLYVRKQLYNIRGSVPDSFDNPLANRILSNAIDPPITVAFSEVVNGGQATMTLEDGTVINKNLTPSVAPGFAIGHPAPGGAFAFLTPAGNHTLSYSHPWHTFTSLLTGADTLNIPLPDLGPPGTRNFPNVFPLSDVFIPVPGGEFDVIDSAAYGGQDLLSIDFFRKDNEDNRVYAFSLDKPDVVMSPDYPDVLFSIDNFRPFRMKAGTWDFWVKFGNHWYAGTVDATNNGTTYVVEFDDIEDFGGTSSPPPSQTYTLHARAVLDSDPTFHIPGLKIQFDNGNNNTIDITTNGTTFAQHFNHQGDFSPLTVMPSTQWVPAVGAPDNVNSYDAEVDTAGTSPNVFVTVRMRRGMGVSGTVNAKNTNGTAPLTGVDVKIRHRFGQTLRTLRTDEDGAFLLDPALPFAQTIFLEVDTPGYFPFRKRFTPGDGAGDGNQVDIVSTIDLTPLPPPEIVSTTADTFDRKGVFLPGVTKSSSGTVLGDDPDVTTTYTVKVNPRELVVTLPAFDSPAGAQQPDTGDTVTDKVTRVWIVDPRWFADDPFKHDPAEPDPVNHMPGMLTKPHPDNAKFPVFVRRDLLDKVLNPDKLLDPPDPEKSPRTFFRQTPGLTGPDGDGVFTAQGSFSLADLPPGPFKPWVIAQTARGTYAISEIEYQAAEKFKNLYGVNLPPWAAAVADTLGTAAAVQSKTSEIQFDKIFPKGFVEAVPGFTGEISVADGFLNYDYGINVKLGEGMDIPGSGFLAMASGSNGFDVNGSLAVSLKGNSTTTTGEGVAEFSLSGEIIANKTIVGIEEYIPKSLSKKARKFVAQSIRENASASIVVGGSAKLETLQRSTGADLRELKIESTTTGGVGLPIEIDLTPIVKTIPTIGHVVAALAETPVKPELIADIDAAIGTSVKRSFTTRFPHLDTGTVAQFGSSDLNPLSPRQHFLGGARDKIDIKVGFEQAYCLRFGVGLTAQVGGGRLGARGHLALAGNQCRLPTGPGGGFQPALKFTRNPHSDWPPITRIQGNLTGGVTAFLDVWIARVEKSWEWELLKIDVQLNSDAVFTLTPITIEERSIPTLGGDAVDWVGLPPTLINRYYTPTGFNVATAPSGNLALVFTDIDPLTGNMVFKIATRTGDHTWSDPVTVTTAPGIVTTAVHPLPGGGWIAVWSELDLAGTTNPFPTSALKFATSADALTWSPPGTIATCGGVAADLRLLDMGSGDLGLVFLESARGPVSQTFDVSASLFSAGTWGACQLVAPDQVVRAWDAAGPGPSGTTPAEIAGLDPDGNLATTTWDGTTVGTPSLLLTNSGNTTLDLATGPDDTFFLVTGNPAGGINLFSRTTPGTWSDLGTPFPTARAQSLTITPTDDNTEHRLALAFTTGADTTAVHFAFLDPSGNILRPLETLLPGGSSLYRNLSLTPRPDTHTASLFTIFEGPGLDQLRTFELDTITGQDNPDRDNDTLPDTEELRIVDADPDDSIHDIDDVHAADDFDQDTATNGTEINAGTDPTDPHSFPGQLVQLFSDVPECFEFGTVPATFNFTRGGDTSQPLTIHYTTSGTATPGTDFPALAGQLTLAPGITHHPLLVSPFGDSEAEGDETIILTLTPDPAYTVGAANAANATISDLPMDGWRFAHFTTAELADPNISGDNIDLENDSLDTLLEYAFARNPKSPDPDGLPVSAIIENGGQQFAALVFVRPVDAEDLFYDVQATTDLDPTKWVSLTPAEYETLSVTDNADGTETVIIRDLTATSEVTSRFLRLRIQRLTDI